MQRNPDPFPCQYPYLQIPPQGRLNGHPTRCRGQYGCRRYLLDTILDVDPMTGISNTGTIYNSVNCLAFGWAPTRGAPAVATTET
ncbi:MAG: hypothetical protein WCR52_19420, partial [Bacteroidota bacterium]